MNILSEVEKAYIAGIIDGEGSIMLNHVQKNKQYSPVVSVASTDQELLAWLKTTTGIGHLSIKPARKSTHRDSWDWKVSYNAALDLLDAVYPYLKIERKKYRARLLLEEYKQLTPRNGKYTEEMLAAKGEFYERFRNELISKTVAQQEAKLQTRRILEERGLSIPPGL